MEVGQAEYIQNVFRFGELEVSDVMVHRTEMVTVNADDPPEEIVNAVLKSEFTRIPLWRGTPENIVGILHAKDLLRALKNADGDLGQIDVMRDRAAALVRARHPAAVGAAQGVPPPQDPLRAGGRRIRRGARAWSRSRTSWRRSSATFPTSTTSRCRACGRSRTARSTSTARCRSAISTAPWTGACRTSEATTIAGLVIHEARSIPDVGQSFTFHGFRFSVLRKERNRITALRITPLVAQAAPLARASSMRLAPSPGALAWIASACTPPASSPRKRLVDHAVAFDPALSAERLRHDMDPEMGLAARAMAGVAFVPVRFVHARRGFAARTRPQASRRWCASPCMAAWPRRASRRASTGEVRATPRGNRICQDLKVGLPPPHNVRS